MSPICVCSFEVREYLCFSGYSYHNYFCWQYRKFYMSVNLILIMVIWFKSRLKWDRAYLKAGQSENLINIQVQQYSLHNQSSFYKVYKNLMTDHQNFKSLLEAEGELNRQIQSALSHFRTTMLENMNPIKKQVLSKSNEYNKQGPEKRFVFRQSLLSVMFQIRDFRTIYNMVVASFIILTFSLFYDNFVKKGQILDMIALFDFFKGAKTVILAWITLAFVFFCIIFVTKIALVTSYYVWLPLYISYIVFLTSIAVYFAKSDDLGFASVIIIMAELTRMIMKAHSYFRTKMLYITDNPYKHFEFRGIKVENTKPHKQQESKDDKCLKFQIKFEDIFREIQKLGFYFFAPTLIYRDSYTLTPVRSFRKAFAHLINFLACVYYSFILYQNWCKPVIQELQKKMDVQSLSSAIINLMLPSVLFLIMGFFGFLHSWLNLWAEMTRFPDRAFYADWWNSVQFGSYYRKWNIIVHDWLYYYIYLDLYRFFPTLRNGRVLAQLLTFVISAIIHEWIIYYAIGFFYPILFILFAGPGMLFMQVASLRKTSVNLIFWLEMYIGSAIMFTLYLVQCFARQKVGDHTIESQWGSFSFLIPRTLYLGR